MQPFTVAEAAAAVGGRLIAGPAERRIDGVSTDSRTIAPGELFVPIRGERFDGHAFLADALRKGAAAVFVEAGRQAELPPLGQACAVAVSNTLGALQDLAAWHRSLFSGPVVAVTGSNGKTTTKDMIAAVLAERFRVLATAGNLNTEIGLALTLLQRDAAHEAVVLEMGMRGRGQIAALAAVARPSIGVVTNVGPVHLELLGTIEAVALAKRELVEALPAGGVAVLNADDARVAAMAAHTQARVVTYGFGPGAQVRAEDVRSCGLDGVAFRLVCEQGGAEVSLPLPGRHNVANALAAAAVGLSCGLDPESVARGLSAVRPSGMRMQIERLAGDVVVLNDAYNASPLSMAAALQALADLPAARRLAVLGDMLELGPVSQEAHLRVGELCAAHGVDLLVTVGERSRDIARGAVRAGMAPSAVTSAADAEEAARIVCAAVRPGDVVLVKASRGMALERIVAALRNRSEGD